MAASMGSTVELALVAGVQISLPSGHEHRRADPATVKSLN